MNPKKMIRLLISGGPGAGCTSTAAAIGERLGVPVFDSDSYFHKPSDPPFQEQYTPEERRMMLGCALRAQSSWVLGGSVATWGLESMELTHGAFLNIPRKARLARLMNRQRNQFGSRIDSGGDMQDEHQSFMDWAAGYEDRTNVGRNLTTDRAYLEAHGNPWIELTDDVALEEVVSEIIGFLSRATHAGA